MTQSRKKLFLLLLSVSFVCLVLISSSLSHLQFQPGLPIPVVEPHYAVRSSESPREGLYSFNFLQGVLGLLLLSLMIYVPARLILFVKIRWLFRLIQILGIILIVILLFYFIRFDLGCSIADCSQTRMIPSVTPILSIEGPPQHVIGYIEVGLALAAILFFFWIFSRLFRRPTVDPVLLHAENAVQDMRSGKDFKSVIVQCYLRMADALQQEQRIERAHSMTSREFEALLASRGFPARPVHELTRLFEKVRYGREPLSNDDERAAIDCLNAILSFAQGKPHG